jgi:hypothetical protein
MRKINAIVIHCSDNLPTQDTGAMELRVIHMTPPPRGMGWRDIGYHFVLRRDGRRELGRPIEQIGAHVAGYNANSIGVCLVGGWTQISPPKYGPNYTDEQWAALKLLLAELKKQFPNADVKGHRDYPNVHKECPCFDARAWAAKEGLA